MHAMEPPLIDRNELVGMVFAIADLSANVERILRLIEEELGGEEGPSQADA